MAVAPATLLGGIGIVWVEAWALVPWGMFFLGFFGLVEIRVLCAHCPHYAEPGTTSLQCWANYGSPKLWRYRPGPMSAAEKAVFFAGLGLIVGYPAVLMLLGGRWLVLVLFAIAVITTGVVMAVTMCRRCMNFACPLNWVALPTRKAFFARNPTVARAWGHRETGRH